MLKTRYIALLAAAAIATGCTITETTSTTSGSVDAVTPDITLNRFVDVRFASIKKEAAAGEGENLDALATLMQTDSAQLSKMLNAHYDELFNDLQQPVELITRIEKISSRSDS